MITTDAYYDLCQYLYVYASTYYPPSTPNLLLHTIQIFYSSPKTIGSQSAKFFLSQPSFFAGSLCLGLRTLLPLQVMLLHKLEIRRVDL